MKYSVQISVLFALLFIFTFNATAQKSKEKVSFRDSTDHAFDVSDWLLNKKGFLLVPKIITEPAVGYGGAAAAVYFHSSYADKLAPPSMTGLFGMGTENGTWGAGVFHIAYWKKDRIRYVGALGRMNVNLDYYGSGKLGLPDGAGSVEMNMNSWLVFQVLKFRLGKTNFFVGGKYFYYNTTNTFDLPIDIPEFSGINFDSNLSEASAIVNYDSRNNVFSPNKGFYIDLQTSYSADWMGGDGLYGRIILREIGYIPATDKLIVGFRNESNFSLGDVPFYVRPQINLRGAPMMKYQSKNTTVTEIEVDWNLYKRWTLTGFTGIGNAFSSFSTFSEGKTVASIGTGFRYLLARKFGMQAGMDFAKSTDDFAFYFVFGSAWKK